MAEYRSSEGKTVLVPYRGPVAATVQDILGGIRSTCTYVGASKVRLCVHVYVVIQGGSDGWRAGVLDRRTGINLK